MKKRLLIIADILVAACLGCCLWFGSLNQEFRNFLTKSAINMDLSLPVGTDSSADYLQKLATASGEHVALSDLYFEYLPYYQQPSSEEIESLETPVELSYYARPGDSEPVYVIPKGTKIVITTLYGGYGYNSFPTAERGWRVAHPFISEGGGEERQGPYYIRTKDLRALVNYYLHNCQPVLGDRWSQYSYWDLISGQIATTGISLSKRAAAHYLLVSNDVNLLALRIFRSKDLFYPVPALWVTIFLCIVFAAANVTALMLRIRNKRHNKCENKMEKEEGLK
ncbi:MAG: hypothetical protein IJM90_01560 [Firmicutes bacterium]|nr:hypothetical protein [Bacillota bacterium]